MWDELTAVAAMRPDTVTIEQRRLAVDADGATLARDDGSVVDVAVAADAAAFDDEFRRVLNGGTLPPTPTLTAEEAAYLDTLSASLLRAGKQAEAAFDDMAEDDAYVPGDGVHHGHRGRRHRHRGRHAKLEPPAGLAEPMRRLYATIDAMQASERALLDAVPHDADADAWDLLGQAFERSRRRRRSRTCSRSVRRSTTSPCSAVARGVRHAVTMTDVPSGANFRGRSRRSAVAYAPWLRGVPSCASVWAGTPSLIGMSWKPMAAPVSPWVKRTKYFMLPESSTPRRPRSVSRR
jgi:hypothetical protein